MSVLRAKARNALASSTFGLPSQRKYPMPDKAHAANAKARATQQVKKGNLSSAERSSIDKKADKVLGIKENSLKDKKKDTRIAAQLAKRGAKSAMTLAAQ